MDLNVLERYAPMAAAWLIAVAIVSIPVYLRVRRPAAYTGLWRGIGEAVPLSAVHVVAFVAALPIGLAVLALAESVTNGGYRSDPLVLIGTSALVLLALGVAAIIVARRLRARRP
jgi:hypothetical protein